MDPDDISLAEGAVIPSDMKCNLSNVAALTSLSHDLATQGQVDETCNGSVTSFRSVESKIVGQSAPSARNHSDRGSVRSLLSVNDGKQDTEAVCTGSVQPSAAPVNYNGRKLVTGNKDEDLFTVESEFDMLSGENCEEQDSADDTGNEDTALSSVSTCDDSDGSTTDIDAIVAEYKETIKVRFLLRGGGWGESCISLNAGSSK
jgi:hypothetical protein